MRLAVYYPWVYLRGGAERMLAELVLRSRHDLTLFTNHFEPHSTFPELSAIPVVCLPRVSVRRTIPKVLHAGFTLMTQRLDLRYQSALLIVSEGLGNLVATRARLPTSCICLTPLKAAYDEATRARLLNDRSRPHYRAALAMYRWVDRPTWRNYVRVFCNSDEVRRRLLDARLVDEARLEVAYHGVDSDRFRPTGERKPFFLVAGRIMWQKRIELALAAWVQFKPRASDSDQALVIAGMVDRKSESYLRELQRLASGRPDVSFVICPTDDELLNLYQSCHAVVFTAINEDWGLVPLEAMACGKAVIATDRGGPRESIVEGETGFLRRAEPAVFAEAIGRLAQMSGEDLDGLATRARARACMFRWETFVNRIDAHADELATRNRDAKQSSRESNELAPQRRYGSV